ncbi:MAG: low-specificity L-threonine aldolase [Oscillochloris sp.]|nr:low-specificity L-threonine aldolase [Oscillochloris sp.]
MYEKRSDRLRPAVVVDLRSDTVTQPSPAMREAINRAELGDDVYGEDPTINRLEALAAELTGKEAAVLVVSGTMGNLTALLAHGQRGQRVILGDESHIFRYEGGGASALGGLVYHTLPTAADGSLPLDSIQQAAAPSSDTHWAPPGLICLENTHNRCGGTVLSPAYMADVHAIARDAGLPLHLDGARVFNAAVALDVPVSAIATHVDSLQFCLSKGLAAPVGSIVAGSQPFIERVRRVRKMVGGGMRQAGIIAAAGIVALTEMVERLSDDHANARALAGGLAAIPAIGIDPSRVQTDIVRFDLPADGPDAATFLAALREHGVAMSSLGPRTVRAVTHYGVEAGQIDQVLSAVRAVLAG